MFGIRLIWIKLAATTILLGLLLFIGHEIADHWREQGRVEIHTLWDVEKTAIRVAKQQAIQKRNEDNAKLLLLYEERNQENIREYERKIELQSRNNARDIANLRAAGGLRLPSSVCSGFAAKANATSTERDNGESTTRLPEQVETGLFNYAIDRDKEIIQLGMCQDWIENNGFYHRD